MTVFPVHVTFRNMDASGAVEANVREKVDKLARFFARIIDCDVVVEAPHRRRHQGGMYNVRIRLGVPGRDIVVGRTGPQDHAHEDVLVAVRDAFDAAQRKLEDFARQARGDVKTHELPLHGKVVRISYYEGYGFVETSDGNEVYFHKNSVAEGAFEDLAVGNEVRLALAYDESPEGPQASTVRPMGKRHIVGG